MQPSYADKRKFIIDTDVGVDDAMAMLYLLKRPDITVLAITIASDGNAHCSPAFSNTLGLLSLLKIKNIPVACGPSFPMRGHRHFPKSVLLESDTLAGAAHLLPKNMQSASHDAVNLLVRTLHESTQPVSILAIGPLTNIAEALLKDPSIKNKISMIYLMGGAIDVSGNLKIVDPHLKNSVAEWNIYLDPMAAARVFQSGISITLVPLDLTQQMPVDENFYHQLQKTHDTAEANFVFELLEHNKEMLRNKQWYFWDPLAAVIASDESFTTFSKKLLIIKQEPESLVGATQIDNANGASIRVAEKINRSRFIKQFLKSLN